jgi:hypothetical protein
MGRCLPSPTSVCVLRFCRRTVSVCVGLLVLVAPQGVIPEHWRRRTSSRLTYIPEVATYPLPDGRTLIAERHGTEGEWHLLIDGERDAELVGRPLSQRAR